MRDIHRPFLDPTPEKVRAFIDAIPLYRDDDDPMFWSDDRLRTRQEELLARQMGWLAEASPHYQKVFADHGIDASTVTSVDDLPRLPVTTKADLMGDPKSFRLAFPQPGLYDLTYHTVYTTGTTTGWPTPYEYTTHDFFGCLQAAIRNNKCSYYVPGDLFFTAFPLSPLPHVAGFATTMTNATKVSFLHGYSGTPYPEFPVHRSSAEMAGLVEESRPDLIAGIGSFLRRMFVDAVAAGRDFSSLKIVVASGEVLTERMRQHMRDHLAKLGAEEIFISSTYGFTEGGVAFTPCMEGGPLHSAAPDQIFVEILDKNTHERVPDGEPGLVAITHLNRRGMPLVRYLLGDISAMTHARCERCGRGGQSLLISSGSAHISRTSELLKIKGTLVNPQVIHDVVMNTPGVIEYQMIVTNETEGDALSAEKLVLRVGLEPECDPARWDGDALRAGVHRATEVRPLIELVEDLSTIYDPTRELKARRIIDQRPAPD